MQVLHGWDLVHEPHVASAHCCAASGWVPVLHRTFSRAAQCWLWDDSSCVPSRNGVQTQEGGRLLKHTSLHPPTAGHYSGRVSSFLCSPICTAQYGSLWPHVDFEYFKCGHSKLRCSLSVKCTQISKTS